MYCLSSFIYWKNKPGKSELIVKFVIEHKDELKEYIENTNEGEIIESIDGINGIPGFGDNYEER